MKHSRITLNRTLAAAAALALISTGALALATTLGDPPTKQAAPEMPLPPGMTAEQMKEIMASTATGPMQAYLAKDAGSWTGAGKFWMTPDAPPSESTIAYTCTMILDGRYLKMDCTSDMGAMGMFTGLGIIGFDNVAKEFQSTWIDSMSTGLMYGTGSLSSDQKTLTINYSFHCPMQKRAVKMRETITHEGNDRMIMRMYGDDPATGKEFLNMEMVYTRNAVAAAK